MDIGRYISEHLVKFQKPFKLSVAGDSMYPVLTNGDSIIVSPCRNSSIKVGDIIVYKKFDDHLTIHRVCSLIKLSNSRFYCETKGDNNVTKDPYKVFNHEIIGVVEIGEVK